MTLIPNKQWLAEIAMTYGVKPHTIESRIARKKFPAPRRVIVNSRVIFVEVPK